MTIRFIYFDLGNVLLDFTHAQGYAQIAALTGLPVDSVQQAMVDSKLNERYERGELSTTAFAERFCEATGAKVAAGELAFAWSAIFTVKPQSVGLAARLVATGNRIGILSNTSVAHWEYVRHQFRALGQLFEPAITSFQIRSMKPEARIYQSAQEAIGIAPDEIFFTDDRPENVAAARELGWHAEVFSDSLKLAMDLEQHGIRFNR